MGLQVRISERRCPVAGCNARRTHWHDAKDLETPSRAFTAEAVLPDDERAELHGEKLHLSINRRFHVRGPADASLMEIFGATGLRQGDPDPADPEMRVFQQYMTRLAPGCWRVEMGLRNYTPFFSEISADAIFVSPEPVGSREYKSYTLTPRVPWLRVAVLSGLATGVILYAMRLNGWL